LVTASVSNAPVGVLTPLRRRGVRWVWSAGVVSDVGTWVQLIVVGSLVARNTGSALQTGLVAVATFLPQGIAAPVGGVIADRVDRRKVFAVCLVGQTVFTTLLGALIAAGHTGAALVSSVIFLQSTMGNIGGPAYQAMLPSMVPPEELLPMISLGIASWNSGRVVGPLLGTVLYEVLGSAGAVFVNAATFAVLAVVIVALRRPFPPGVRDAGSTPLQEFRVGWRAFAHGRHGKFLFLSMVVVSMCITPFMGLLPIFAKKLYHGGTGTAGLFSSAQGVGALVGVSVLARVVAKLGRSTVLGWSIPVVVGAYVVYLLSSWTPVAMLMIATMGLGTALWFSTIQVTSQRDAAPESRARVMSLVQASFGISYGFGLLAIGRLSDVFGLRPVCIGVAVCGVLGTIGVQRSHPTWRRMIDHGPDISQAG
jgi:MFS family permease